MPRYSVERDITPIVLVGVMPNLLIGNPQLKTLTVKDIVAACKAEPGKVSFGSAGAGSAQHLAPELFKLQAKVDALPIPYKGRGPLLIDLIGGQINDAFETMTAATPHVKNGNATAIAQTRAKRAKGHPNVPTMQELGFAGFEAATWYGLAGQAARGHPAEGEPRRQHRAGDARCAAEARHLRRRGRRRQRGEVRRLHHERDRHLGACGEGGQRQSGHLTLPDGRPGRRQLTVIVTDRGRATSALGSSIFSTPSL